MTLVEVYVPPVAIRPTASLIALTRHEMRRYARHPLFLAGLLLTALSCYLYLHDTLTDPGGLPGYPATFLGVFGIVIGFRLSHSLREADEALDVTPASPQLRTAALCLAALVPFAAGVATLAVVLSSQRPAGQWTYGVFGTSDRFAVLAGELAVAALGGPLLGIAVARWVRSFWFVLVVVPVVYVWAGLVNGLTTGRENSVPFLWLRMFTPYTYFLSKDGNGSVATWRGSPWFFLGWQLSLCALAVTVAMLRDATRRRRRILLASLAAICAVAVAMYLLAVTGGLQYAVISYPGTEPL